MAGVRIGYALGSSELVKALNDVKYSFNSYTMNQPSIVLGTASIEEEDYFRETTQKIIDTREWFKKQLKTLGFISRIPKPILSLHLMRQCPPRISLRRQKSRGFMSDILRKTALIII